MAKKIFDLEKYAQCARLCAAEGVVLLKNDNNALPLAAGTKIALFGRSQYNYYKSGTGSGGMVNTRYVIGVKEALKEDDRFTLESGLEALYDAWIKDHPFDPGQGWASEPWFQAEMPITDEIAGNAAKAADVAIVLIGRTAGEDQDNKEAPGSWLLTEDEEQMLAAVTGAFEKTIVLMNVGNIMDMNWVAKYDPAAVAYIWQGGQEGGRGAVDVLSGDVNPDGHLTDTIAMSIGDYPAAPNFGSMKRNIQQEDIYVGYRYFETFAPDKVLYPFGCGLSYTDFSIEPERIEWREDCVTCLVSVENTGTRSGSRVIQLYMEAPQGLLGKPARVLVGFAKTGQIEPGKTGNVHIKAPEYLLASYDDAGKTGHRSAYVLEAGEYTFYAGDNVRDAKKAGSFTLPETRVVMQMEEAMAPVIPFDRMVPVADADGRLTVGYEPAPQATLSALALRAQNLPAEIAQTGDMGIKLADVAAGKASLDDFIAQMSDEDLTCIVRGEGMSSPKVTPGCGGAFGGVTDSLLALGIPVACCSDGPSGIRMDSGRTAFAMPNGTCLAATWDEELQEELYKWEGLELRKNKIDVLLGPGMNLHRHPLNGRNFEYFSEDPLLGGKCAAAQLRGMQTYGVTGTIKHFAMNTQESGRHTTEHVASERAIRELYLRGFELAVKEGGAHAVMATYGPVNGFYTSANYDLLTRILRGEWGFGGIVMTDWWAMGNDEGKPGDLTNMASMIRAQNDLNMVTTSAADNTTHDNSLASLAAGTVTRAEYQRAAANICRFIMGKPVFARLTGIGNELDLKLEEEMDDEELSFENMIDCRLDESGTAKIDVSAIDCARGKTTMISVAFRERGIYKITLKLRAVEGLSDLAQIPLTIYKDKELAAQITLNGAEREWKTEEVMLSFAYSTFYLKLFFAQAGMEIGEMEISLAQSFEEEVRRALAERMAKAAEE